MSSGNCRSFAPVTDTSLSPHCRLRPVPLGAVRLTDGFWAERLRTNRQVSIPAVLKRLRAHHVLENFMRLYGASDASRERRLATDSDVYKWLEAACYALANEDDPELRSDVERALDAVLPAQEPSGYLNTAMVEENRDRRWQDFQAHEFYCAGHMFQAAVAHRRATGQERFLEAAVRFADYLCERFGPEGRDWYPGHPEVELALVELYRQTGHGRYLELASCLLERNRDVDPEEIRGHAVRALYYDCGLADCCAETGHRPFQQVLDSHWRTLTGGKMYVTGGVGSRPRGEMVGEMYELPNMDAYAETCAAAANVFLNWRMLTMAGEARFADVLETALYNGFLAGVSLDGLRFFYVNPLASTGRAQPDPWYEWARSGPHQRQEFFTTTCCPPNVLRLLAALPGHFYSTSAEGVWVNLYGSSEVAWQLPDGRRFGLRQETDYPWSGTVRVEFTEAEGRFSLFLRVPGWCPSAGVRVNGQDASAAPEPGTYLELDREWRPGETVRLELAMEPTFVESHPRVQSDRGTVAIRRGPIIYCLEEPDNPEADLFGVRVDPAQAPECRHRPDLLGGVTEVKVHGKARPGGDDAEPLYLPVGSRPTPELRAVELTAIPYYAWANRGPAQMTVWMMREDAPWT